TLISVLNASDFTFSLEVNTDSISPLRLLSSFFILSSSFHPGIKKSHTKLTISSVTTPINFRILLRISLLVIILPFFLGTDPLALTDSSRFLDDVFQSLPNGVIPICNIAKSSSFKRCLVLRRKSNGEQL